jgi:glutathionyl-hydroquinone reductase
MKKREKRMYTKKMYGGKFNKNEKVILKETLTSIWKKSNETITKHELKEIMKQLDDGSQQFSGKQLQQLTSQIAPLNKEQFEIWVREIYPLFVEDVETDYESPYSSQGSNASTM